jgi:hypothetical protein
MLRVEVLQAGQSRCLVLSPSRMVRHDFQRVHRVSRDRLRVVPNGVDVERFSPERGVEHREPVRRALGLADEAITKRAARGRLHRAWGRPRPPAPRVNAWIVGLEADFLFAEQHLVV